MSVLTADPRDLFLENDFEVGVVDTLRLRKECGRLVNAMYSWRGYEVQEQEDYAPGNDVTLHVSREQQVIATMTICHDSASGIPADALYKAEIDQYRARESNVCELTRLAVDPTHRSKEVLGALFCHAHFHAAICGGATEALIEVNPRHVAFYKRVMKFRQVGEAKMCPRVNAPAVLLHQQMATIGHQIAQSSDEYRRDRMSPQAYRTLAGARAARSQRQPAYAS